MSALFEGLANLFTWPGILIPVLGTLIAMTASFLPGIGMASLSALLILWTIDWEPEAVLLLFGALTGGATFMGSITGILFNIPGNSSSAAILLDGYALSRNGFPRTAIAAAATASAVGSIFGVFVLMALIPVVRDFILEFGPLERLLIGVWGLSTIAAIPNSSTLKAIAVTLLGLMLAMIGTDPISTSPRWTFGATELLGGISAIAVLIGYFTVSELISWQKNYVVNDSTYTHAKNDTVAEGIKAVFTHRWLTLRSSIIGTLVGIIPGVGGTVAGFVAYGHAVQTAIGNKENFGKGDIRGLIGPEASVDAKDGGSLLPALAFGLPGSEAGIILVTVLAIHGMTPGTPMLSVDLDLTFTLIFALLLSNILTSIVGVALTPALAKLSYLPVYKLGLPVFIASTVSIIHINGSLSDLYIAICLGVFGFLLKHFDWPRVPLIISFILGDFFEANMMVAERLISIDRLHLFERPASIVMIIMIFFSILWMLKKNKKDNSNQPIRPYNYVFSGIIAFISFILFAVSIISDNYSLYSKITSAICSIILIIITLNDINKYRGKKKFVLNKNIPNNNLLIITIIVTTPILIWLIGIGPSFFIITFLWTNKRPIRNQRRMISVLAVAAIMGTITYYYFDFLSNVLLPEPAILKIGSCLAERVFS